MRRKDETPKASMSRLFACAIGAALMLWAGPKAGAQFLFSIEDADISRFPIVEIPFRVVDYSANITAISADQFVLTENGIPQQIAAIDCQPLERNDSLKYAFVLDESYSMGFVFGHDSLDIDSLKWNAAREAFRNAIGNLRPTDEASLYVFFEFVARLQEFTYDKRALLDALEGAVLSPGTSIYDAIERVVVDVAVENTEGKIVMILLTDGSDRTSRITIDEAIAHARAAGIPIYVIGLDVLPDDEITLRRIADETGGEYHYAPSAEELAAVMARIKASIFSHRCVLRYVSSDSCADGRMRNVDVSFSAGGTTRYASTSYTLPDRRITHSIGASALNQYDDESSYLIPIVVSGPLRSDQAFSISFDCVYDPAILQYESIDLSGTLLDGTAVQAAMTSPGIIRIEIFGGALARFVASNASDTLCFLRFTIAKQERILSTTISLANVSIGQDCPALSTPVQDSFDIVGCPSRVRFAIDSTMVFNSGSRIVVPLLVQGPLDVAQECDYSMVVQYDEDVLEYIGVEQEGTVTAKHALQALQQSPGRIDIAGGNAKPAFGAGVFINLVFTVTAYLESRASSISVTSADLVQTCVPELRFEGATFLINGICEKIVRLKSGLRLSQNRPNPVSPASPFTVFDFQVEGKGVVRFDIVDNQGKTVALLIDKELPAGRHSIAFSPADLPSGIYTARLTENGAIQTKTVVWSK